MEVSNAPATEGNGQVSGYKPFVFAAPKLLIAISPVNGACLSSGFGLRSGKSHNGIDLQSKPAGMVHAAAAGKVREAGFRADFGIFVVIDHGQDVFTRYAHLKNIEPGLSEGASIAFGTPLGMMGQTASHPIPIHLHYELLTGNYETQKKSFGLKSINPFDLPQQ
jgi:murein DD-endopeptidase MepM/ murein hydrolase activator NlpD